MKRDDWMLFGLVFLTGFAIGIYVYVAAFKPIYTPEDLSGVESEASEWSIIGKRRGGDVEPGYIQPSFRVLGDGSYAYLQGGEGDGALEPREGKLPGQVVRSLQVTETELEAYSQSVTGECLSREDDFEYEYRIIYSGEDYFLDTCRTALGRESDLSEALEDVWQYLEGGSSGRPAADTPSEWLENWLYDAIHSSE